MASLDLIDDEDSPPATQLISVEDLKRHSRVDFPDDNDEIEAYLKTARRLVEGHLKRSLLLTTYQYRIDYCWPREIRLPIGPLRTTSGLSIQYVDANGDTQTLATTEYQVSLGMTGRIRPAWSKSWPTIRPVMDAITVTFKAGEQTVPDVNSVFIQAVRLHVEDFYANRGALSVGATATEILSLSARNLLTPFVRHD